MLWDFCSPNLSGLGSLWGPFWVPLGRFGVLFPPFIPLRPFLGLFRAFWGLISFLLGPFLGSYFLPFGVTVGHFGVPFPSFNPLGPFWVLFGHFWVPFPSFPAGGSSHGLSHACGSPYGVTVGRALILGPNE